ncbi:unnamed protein product, partial [Mesorhabditis belari]|uniref:Uncharacterized protein n=1 Tax=Mesorhabditis belari TaxID=2138241 RepID=A0AAF3EMP5_9BILA
MNSKEDREKARITIVELHKNGKKPQKIMKATGYKKDMVYKALKRYRETGGITDRKGRGRPATVTTPQNFNKLRCRIRRNPEKSMRDMAKKLNLGRESVRLMICKKLKLVPYKIARAHFLDDPMKAKRLQRARV